MRSRNFETVLVCDDDDGVRKLVSDLLVFRGYRVLEASNGRQALELAARHGEAIDLLVTDVVMPGGMTGADLARIVRSRWPRIRILFTSGYANPTLISDVDFGRGTLLLQKPYSKADLAHKLREALDGGRQEGVAGGPTGA